MQQRTSQHASWQDLLSRPAPGAHYLQIYDHDDFLAAAVAHFAAQGLQRDEAVLLTGTPGHLRLIGRALGALDVDAAAAARDERLFLVDAQEGLDALTERGTLDAARFEVLAGELLGRARGPARRAVRWWGEMSAVLIAERGNLRAALDAEKLAGALAKERAVTLFCSYLCDRFDPAGYAGLLRHICPLHSHAIPAEDYAGHRLAVNRAVAEVVGDIRGTLLQSLSSWKGLDCEVPSSQAVLFWLQEALPEKFEAVLARARAHHAAGLAERPTP